jgi:hypothetical protein
MTEEYKKNILDYITNNVEIESGNNIPLFNDTSTISKSIRKDLTDEIGSGYTISGVINDQDNQIIIVYGYDTNDKGFIYLVDIDLNKITLIRNFASGSDLFRLIKLQQDEEGNYYGVSQETDKTARVLLLNNITAKLPNGEYRVILRRSYIIPNSSNYTFESSSFFSHQPLPTIKKVPGEATYYIIGGLGDDYSDLIRFKIIVGEENEWWTRNHLPFEDKYDLLIEKNGTEHILYMFSVYVDDSSQSSSEVEFKLEGDTLTTYRYGIIYSLSEGDERYAFSSVIAKNLNDVYVTITDYATQNTLLAKMGYVGTAYKALVMNTFEQNAIFVFSIANGTIITYHHHYDGSNHYAKVGIIQDSLYESNEVQLDYAYQEPCVIYNYNLLLIYLFATNNSTIEYTLDYNQNNYNGLPYNDYNQTIPRKARLYSNGEMVFARNLYNTTILNSTTTNTLNVPNTLLNGINIDLSNLVSETNSVMVSKDTNIVKNIYENLFINFVNTLNVIDEDTNNTYPGTANYITQNINTGTEANCNNTFVGKVRINYSTPITKRIIWVWNEDHYETSYGIDTREEVPTTVDFISDDNTIYLTKEITLESNKLYLAKQKLRIE